MERPATRSTVTTAALAAIAGFGHVIYPVVLGLRSQRLADPLAPDPLRWPTVTAVVPAYREQAVIARKIENLRDNGYPGALEVIVVAEDAPTADAARQAGARVLAPTERLGKAAALNLGVAAATGDVVVISDANAHLAPDAMAMLVAWFADPVVGAVAGEKQVEDEAEGIYWRFESWLKQREARLGSTIGLVGELAAFRKALYRPLPSGVVIDDLWIALDVIGQGSRVVYEPRARTLETASDGLGAEWERRTRNIAGLNRLFVRRWRELVPGSGPASFQLWGHRFVRSSVGPIAHLVLLRRAVPSAARSRAARLFLAAHVVAVVGLLARARGHVAPQPFRLGGQVLFLQLVALGGLLRFLRGDLRAAWPKEERVAPPDSGVEQPELARVEDVR